MKKRILFSIVFSIMSFYIQAQPLIKELIDSEYSYTYISALDSSLLGKTLYYYDSKGNDTLMEFYKFNNTTNKWVGDYQNKTIYNTMDQVLLFIENDWDTITNRWFHNKKNEYTYNATGHKTLFISYDWDTLSNQWIGNLKIEDSYNANENDTLSITYRWNTTTNLWRNSTKFEKTYNTNEKDTIGFSYFWDTNYNKWNLSSKVEYTHNTNSKLTISSKWDSIKNKWVLNNKTEYTFDDNLKNILQVACKFDTATNLWVNNSKQEHNYDKYDSTYSYYYWNSNQWVCWFKYEWIYGENNKKVFKKINYYTSNNGQCYNCMKIEYFYNTNDKLSHSVAYNWDTTSNQYILSGKDYYYTHTINNTNTHNIHKENFKLYPNPTSDKLTIDCTEKINNLYIYNLLGGLVFQQQLNNGFNEINVSNLQTGIYVIKLKNEQGTIQQKLIKK